MMTHVRTAADEPADLLAAVGGFCELTASDSAEAGFFDSSYLERYLNHLEQLSELAGELGYAGLQGACLIFQENVQALLGRDAELDEQERSALETWQLLVQSYLELPPDAGAGEALADHLQLSIWDVPLDPTDAEVLRALLVDERRQAANDGSVGEPASGMDDVRAFEDNSAVEGAVGEDLCGCPGDQQSEATRAADEVVLEHGDVQVCEGTNAADAVAGEDLSREPEHYRCEEVTATGQDGREAAEGEAAAAWQSDAPPEEDLPSAVSELVAVLLDEIPLMEEPLQKLLQAEVSAEQAPAGRADAYEVYADYLERFGEAAEAVGFSGLQQVVALVRENMALLAAQPRALSAAEIDLLDAWSGQVSVYLCAPHSFAACQGLLEWMQAPEWPLPLAADQVEALLPLLQAPTLPEEELEEEVEKRPAQAVAEDVSLALPEDVNTELLDALLQELPGQTQTFSEAIQNLIAGGSLDDVNVAQRTAHTVKGAGNTVGVVGLATLTHHLEDILVALAKDKALPTPALALSLMNAADCLEAMGEALCGIADPPDNAQEVLQEVLDWANRIDREGLPEADAAAPTEPVTQTAAASQPATAPAEVAPVERAQKPQSQAQSSGATTRVATELVDDLLRLGGETIILSGQVHEQARRIEERMRAMEAEFDRLHQLGGDLERLIDIRDLSADRPQQPEYTEFDSLEMDQYSELHTTSRMLVEAATDARQIGGMVTEQLQRLDKLLLTQERLNRETQEMVLSARMVPIKTQVSRLQRSVRQTCRLTGKQARLHVSGAETLMDGEVLGELIDPLMHVLRNAVDHGIESPAQRSAAGKPEEGTISLDFVREGNNILVRCRDDGAGFDFAAIRRAAETKGLLEPGQAVSEEELKNLMLMPNFSTRSTVTQTSGRGVGLDVVYSHVLSHGGSLTLNTELGQGSTTELRLPVSLISTHALLVRLRSQVIAVADRGIEQILHGADGSERKLGDQLTFQVGQQHYPLRRLDEILGLGPDPRATPRGQMPVLLVRDRTGVTAVLVQEVSAGTDLVVKEFGRYVPRLPGIVGATILGDGAVTPVLDLPELMAGARRPIGLAAAEAVADARQEGQRRPVALVVDDSLSARRALVQVMEDAGYDVRAARDGLEAVEIAQGKRPDIVLADMEMPRMNGIELTSHLRARPETADLPVIMITSRSTAKHRQQAEAAGVSVYLTKPFLDDELLDHVAALRGQLGSPRAWTRPVSGQRPLADMRC
jgi:chemosensory pili system protein ChpA (sensor histidine kinase/response regulator)